MKFKDFLNEFSLRTENTKINHPLLGTDKNSYKAKNIRVLVMEK